MEAAVKRAVFLDRDGTVNEEVDYLYRIEDFAFIPGAPGAIRRLKEAGYLVIVVTNQSGVARGYFPLEAVHRLHEHIRSELEKFGTSVDAFYICPHHPKEGVGEYRVDCDCRKGSPGMLIQAALDHGIDLSRSFIVGDKASDMEAGVRGGCRPLLVLTGHGSREREHVAPETPVFRDLLAAAEYVVSQEGLVF